MAKKMGTYCKAYLLKTLREFPDWTEHPDRARQEKHHVNGEEGQAPRTLADDSIVYLQEDYTVTDDIFLDEHVIFDAVTPEWKAFCQQTLQFEVPPDQPTDS